MSEWTTDTTRVKPGWLVEQDCLGVSPGGIVYEVTKAGHVVSCDERVFRALLSTPLGEDEVWVFAYSGHGMKLKVRPADE